MTEPKQDEFNGINLQDPIGKWVGRKRPQDGVAYGVKLQEAAATYQESAGFRVGKKGVFRFRSHEEADQWLRTIQTQRKT
jgi:hypothetical protein